MSRDTAKSARHPAAIPYSELVLITGGAGFIGTNLAHRLLSEGCRVRILDNLSRHGVESNARWLAANHDASRLDIRIHDVRDARAVAQALEGVGKVFHLAAQVAVTTSITDPLEDFDINCRGTLTLLEAIRHQARPPALVFTSTNKVYGNLENVALRRNGTRYEPAGERLRRWGIGEKQALQFWSPYGCSKGTADQYILDYARIYRLETIVFRMSCIYGPHQFGTEDQGWVAHFLISSRCGNPITIFGDGLQVRDLLYVDDLMDAMVAAGRLAPTLKGNVFNIGGGPANMLSLKELLALIGELEGRRPVVRYAAWRHGDQRYFAADIRRFKKASGWKPRVGVRDGVAALHRWLGEHRAEQPQATWDAEARLSN